MRRFSWLSPFVIVALLGALPALAENAAQPQASYLAPGEIDFLKLLPPPPASDSAAGKRDIQAMLDAQRHRTPAEIKRVEADGEVSVFRFADVMGSDFTKDKLPRLAAFFDRVQDAESPLYGAVKNHWNRPRPFVASTRVHALPALKEGVYNQDKHAYSFSFPSGHSTFGATYAILLSQMVPEKQAELFTRGWQYGQNRVVGGVHYPTDVEAGRIDATVMVYAMMQHPQFQKDFAEARAELRGVLGLAP
jgi:acid phosphatase (class A)